jgi:DNA topoisomerase IA
MYIYFGSTETLFDQRGFSTSNNFLFKDLNEFEGLSVDTLTKEEFEKKVALPFKLGFLTEENPDIRYSFASKNSLVIAQDLYDGVCYIFVMEDKPAEK